MRTMTLQRGGDHEEDRQPGMTSQPARRSRRPRSLWRRTAGSEREQPPWGRRCGTAAFVAGEDADAGSWMTIPGDERTVRRIHASCRIPRRPMPPEMVMQHDAARYWRRPAARSSSLSQVTSGESQHSTRRRHAQPTATVERRRAAASRPAETCRWRATDSRRANIYCERDGERPNFNLPKAENGCSSSRRRRLTVVAAAPDGGKRRAV